LKARPKITIFILQWQLHLFERTIFLPILPRLLTPLHVGYASLAVLLLLRVTGSRQCWPRVS
jgi:TRAP-type mannitol/chloroaromatic compound transport system permease large subunit